MQNDSSATAELESRRRFLRGLTQQLLAVGIASGTCWRSLISAEEPLPVAEAFVPSAEFQTFITSLAREHIPPEYERKKNWGAQKEVLDGVAIELDGIRLDTKRRWKEVNHGTWQWYRLTQIHPEQNLTVRIEEVREMEGGQVHCLVSATARMHCFGRQSKWERGVQIYSISAEAQTNVKLTARAALRPRLDPQSFPPDIILLTKIEEADLEINDFQLHRVSHFDGPVVQALSKSVREVLEDVIAAQRPKMVEKINVKIEKEQDKLRLKWADLLQTPWGDLAEKLQAK